MRLVSFPPLMLSPLYVLFLFGGGGFALVFAYAADTLRPISLELVMHTLESGFRETWS